MPDEYPNSNVSPDEQVSSGMADAVQTTTGAAKALTGQATDAAKEIAATAKDQASNLANQATDAVTSKIEDSKGDVAEQIGEIAKVLQQSGEQLEGRQDWLAKLVTEGASELGGLAETLKTNDLHGLIGKLDELARRQPAVFVGAAMAVGFATVRLGKVAVAGATNADLPKMPEMSHEPG